MTPKEKAQELLEKFEPYISYECMDEEWNAKECALIAVNTALFAVTEFANYEGTAYHFEDYWNEVKQELEKL